MRLTFNLVVSVLPRLPFLLVGRFARGGRAVAVACSVEGGGLVVIFFTFFMLFMFFVLFFFFVLFLFILATISGRCGALLL